MEVIKAVFDDERYFKNPDKNTMGHEILYTTYCFKCLSKNHSYTQCGLDLYFTEPEINKIIELIPVVDLSRALTSPYGIFADRTCKMKDFRTKINKFHEDIRALIKKFLLRYVYRSGEPILIPLTTYSEPELVCAEIIHSDYDIPFLKYAHVNKDILYSPYYDQNERVCKILNRTASVIRYLYYAKESNLFDIASFNRFSEYLRTIPIEILNTKKDVNIIMEYFRMN